MTQRPKKDKHPQAPPFANTQEMEAFLARPLLARFCSHNQDGTIHIAPLYYRYAEGEFTFATQYRSRKVQNILRDPRVTILIDATEPILQSVMAYGVAQLDEEDVVDKRVEILAPHYPNRQSARAFAERLARAWRTVIIRLRPTHIVTVDYSKPFSVD